MNADTVLREQLVALLRGGNAHMSFDEAVKDFPLDKINALPPNVSYTPWHLIEHLRITQWDILEFVRNPAHVSPPWPEGYWPAPGTQADAQAWEATVAAFRRDLADIEALATSPDTNLTAPIPHAPDYTILREILLAADHNAYHIGELGILRQVMQAWG
ncbi:DinB family protein [Chloroflexia bacterium SDU3-3]|nr:DinB family protein [Chloroflexia bacterium SDU3-3]